MTVNRNGVLVEVAGREYYVRATLGVLADLEDTLGVASLMSDAGAAAMQSMTARQMIDVVAVLLHEEAAWVSENVEAREIGAIVTALTAAVSGPDAGQPPGKPRPRKAAATP